MIIKEAEEILLKCLDADQAVRESELSTEADVTNTDRHNAKQLQTIIALFGWPILGEFSEMAVTAAYFIALHADHDLSFQKNCLLKSQQLPIEQRIRKYEAYLTDRIAVAETGIQVYGTQTKDLGDELMLYPIQNDVEVEELRREVGLEPLDAYLQIMEEVTGVRVIRHK